MPKVKRGFLKSQPDMASSISETFVTKLQKRHHRKAILTIVMLCLYSWITNQVELPCNTTKAGKAGRKSFPNENITAHSADFKQFSPLLPTPCTPYKIFLALSMQRLWSKHNETLCLPNRCHFNLAIWFVSKMFMLVSSIYNPHIALFFLFNSLPVGDPATSCQMMIRSGFALSLAINLSLPCPAPGHVPKDSPFIEAQNPWFLDRLASPCEQKSFPWKEGSERQGHPKFWSGTSQRRHAGMKLYLNVLFLLAGYWQVLMTHKETLLHLRSSHTRTCARRIGETKLVSLQRDGRRAAQSKCLTTFVRALVFCLPKPESQLTYY